MKTETRNGQTCYFDEKEHKYFVGDTVLTSVTQFINGFFPEFELEKVAAKYAKKHKLDKDKVLAEWAAKGEAASELGKLVHGYIESVILSNDDNFHIAVAAQGKSKDISDRLEALKYEKYILSAENALHSMLSKGFQFIAPERIVWSLCLLLSGTIDLIASKDRTLYILDWKTNQEMKMSNSWRFGLPPITSLDDCNIVHYGLQVNLYERIIVEENLFPEFDEIKKVLVHLKNDGTYKLYPITNMQNHVEAMLSWI